MSSAVKTAYASSATPACTLASLASDTNLLAGRSSILVDNTTNLYTDYGVAGFVSTGTSPTAGIIQVFAVGLIDDSTWPDTITGSDAGVTFTSTGTRDGVVRQVASIATSATSNVKYPFGPVSLAGLFGGFVPKKFVFWVVHNTVAVLNATGGNHEIAVTGSYFNVG